MAGVGAEGNSSYLGPAQGTVLALWFPYSLPTPLQMIPSLNSLKYLM